VQPVDGRVDQLLALTAAGDRAGALVERERLTASRRSQEPAVGPDDLDVALGPAERLRRHLWDRVGRELGDRVGALVQRGVDLVAQLAAHAQVDGDRDHDHGQCDGEPRRGRDARAQGHGSRRT
jgi:hypothetical protein